MRPTRRTLSLGAMTLAALAAAPMAAFAQAAAPAARAPARPFLLLDQIRSGPFPRTLAPAFEPLKTLEEVEAVLKANAITYKRGAAMIDMRTAPLQLVQILSGLPPGEVFILPEGGGFSFSRIVRALSPEDAAKVRQAMPGAPATPKT